MKLRIDIETDSEGVEDAIVALLDTFGAVLGKDDGDDEPYEVDLRSREDLKDISTESVKPKRGPHGRRR